MCAREPADADPGSALLGLASDVAVVYLHVILPEDMRDRLPSTSHAWRGFATEAGREPAAVFEQFVSSIEPTDRPPLYFAHTLLPHVPWRYLPSGRTYRSRLEGPVMEGWVLGGGWGPDEWAVVQGFQRHLLQLGLVDRLVGDLVARLKAVGLYDEALVILTADHGLAFRASRPRRGLARENVADIGAVPLLVKYPGQQAGEVHDENVETVDIVPTIADVLDVEVPWAVDGRSLLGPPRAAGEPKRVLASLGRTFVEVDPRLSARWGTLDQMLALFGSGADAERLYRIGPYAGLVGRSLATLEARAADGRLALTLADPDAWDAVDPAAAVLPVKVEGRIAGPGGARGPIHLAVSVNGAVRAVTRTRAWDAGVAPFYAMVPEWALRAGGNAVDVLLVSGPPAWPSLQHLERRP
jgi:hypothetical protein